MSQLWTTGDFDNLIDDLRAPEFWDTNSSITFGFLGDIISHLDRKGKSSQNVFNATIRVLKPALTEDRIPKYANIKRKVQSKRTSNADLVVWCEDDVSTQPTLGPFCGDRKITLTTDLATNQEIINAPPGFGLVVNGVILELRAYWSQKKYTWNVFANWLRQLGVLNPLWSEERLRQRVNSLYEKHQSYKRNHNKLAKQIEQQPFVEVRQQPSSSPPPPLNRDYPLQLQTYPTKRPKVIETVTAAQQSAETDTHGEVPHPQKTTPAETVDAGIQAGKSSRNDDSVPIARFQQFRHDLSQTRAILRKVRKNNKRREERRDIKIHHTNSRVKHLQQYIATLKRRRKEVLRGKRKISRQKCRLRRRLRETVTRAETLSAEVERLKSKLQDSQRDVQTLTDEVKHLSHEKHTIATFVDGKYINPVRQTVMALASLGIGTGNIGNVLQTVSSGLFGATLSPLPSETTVKDILKEGNLIAKVQVGKVLLEEHNTTLHGDGTSDHQRHFFGFQVATKSHAYALTLAETVRSDATTQLQELEKSVGDLVSLLATDPAEMEDLHTQMIFSIKNLMTDQHVVNKKFKEDFQNLRMNLLQKSESLWDALTPEERTDTVRLHQWFCFLHVLLGFSDATESALINYEDILTDGGTVPLGRARTSNDHRREGSAALEAVRSTCSMVTPSGHPAAGIPEDFRAWMSSREKPIFFVKFAHNRFNVVFQNSSALYYHREHVREFLSNVVQTNQLIAAVTDDLKDDNLMACVRGIAVFHLLVTSPFHTLVLTTSHILHLNPYLVQLRTALEEMSSNPSCILRDGFCVWEDIRPKETDMHTAVIPKSGDEEHLDITLEVLSLLATHSLVMFARQVAPQLPGGEHGNPSPCLQAESASVATSNSVGESQFAYLKYLRQIKPSACVETIEASIMWAYNKTLPWLQQLPTNERDNIMEMARRKCSDFKEKWSQRRKTLTEQRLQHLDSKQKQTEQKTAKRATGRQQTLDAVEELGGQCRTSADVDRLLEGHSGADLLNCLKSQLRFYKNIVSPPGINKSLYNFSRLGKALSPKQLSENLKKIISFYDEYLKAVPSTSHNPSIPEQSIRQKKLHEARKAVLCNYSTMSEDKPSFSCRRGKKTQSSLPEVVVGKKIRHRWAVGKGKRWYRGQVVSLSTPGELPNDSDGEDDNMATGSVYQLYDVSYEGEEELFHIRLEKDWYRGDLEILD